MAEENKEVLTQQPAEPEVESNQEELHTAHEAELTKQISELNATIKQLQEQNRKMFIKLSGQQDQQPQDEDPSAVIDRLIMEHLHAKDYKEEGVVI